MNSSRPYLVRALYEWIVDNECTPHLLVTTEHPQVQVPKGYDSDGQIVLNVSPTAIRHLHMDNKAVSFEGSFGGINHSLFVPVEAIMGIYARENGQGMVFELEPVLEEELDEPESEQEGSDDEPTPPQPPRPTGKPSLKVVK